MTDQPSQPSTSPGGGLPTVSVPNLAVGFVGNVAYETPQETTHRLTEAERQNQYKREQDSVEAKHKRWRSNATLTVALATICVLAGYCVSILRDAQVSTDDKKWATAILTSVCTGMVGFATGKGTG